MNKKLTFAVDFDGCLCNYSFPNIGEQTDEQKELLALLIKLQQQGHRMILWTCRGVPVLQEAIDWCAERGLQFDAINTNPWFKKESGPSPKIVADYYIDDKSLEFPPRGVSTLDLLTQLQNDTEESTTTGQ